MVGIASSKPKAAKVIERIEMLMCHPREINEFISCSPRFSVKALGSVRLSRLSFGLKASRLRPSSI